MPMAAAERLSERLWARIEVDENGCWLWQGSTYNGYGKISWGGRTVKVHRLAYEQAIGPIPCDLALDHLCRTRNCIMPHHLEPVTWRENLLRGKTIAARNVAKTHCKHGHEFTEANTYYRPTGGRSCRECVRRWLRESRARKIAGRKTTEVMMAIEGEAE